jgi:hypothetical protein
MQLPLHIITTHGMALLTTYRLLFGTTFRPSQLAIALTKCKQSIEQLFSRDDVARLLTFPSSFSPTTKDIIPLLVSCGIFAE